MGQVRQASTAITAVLFPHPIDEIEEPIVTWYWWRDEIRRLRCWLGNRLIAKMLEIVVQARENWAILPNLRVGRDNAIFVFLKPICMSKVSKLLQFHMRKLGLACEARNESIGYL